LHAIDFDLRDAAMTTRALKMAEAEEVLKAIKAIENVE
jgi:hypothetical protein